MLSGSIDLVKKGIRWRVGNGENINIWQDSWIPITSCMQLITHNLLDLGSSLVSVLINDVDGC